MDETLNPSSENCFENAPLSSHDEFLMGEESGILESQSHQQESEPIDPMSTCTLEQHVTLEHMNEAKDLSRPPSGSMNDLEEAHASKRFKVNDGAAQPIKTMDTAAHKNSIHIEVAPSVSIDGSKGKPGGATSTSSDVTPQATTTSISEGSSELSLEARHAHSRPSSSTQLASSTTSEHTKPAATSASSLAPKALHPASVKPVAAAAPPPSEEPLPIKSLTMMHLHKKYTAELEYMLREFRKLERQLLGAKGNGVEENAGSRERREKLHSFILHLENTLQQIQLGVSLEAEGKSTVMVGVTVGEVGGKVTAPTAAQVKQQLADSGALATLTKEKEEEENVQKLEEHILANLLPVKVRLKKQLAAQQGASRNPVGMPVARRGMLPSSSADKGTGTFAAAAEKKRQQAEAAAAGQDETQFGKPLAGGASSLTQKLHGQTLGSSKRKYGHGVGSAEPGVAEAKAASTEGDLPQKRKILYAGMAPGSKQLKSGVSAASGAHKMVIETPALYGKSNKAPKGQAKVPDNVPSTSVRPSKAAALPQHPRGTKATASHPGQKIASARQSAASKAAPRKQKRHDDPSLTEEERKKLRKQRKQKKRRKLAKKRERERQMHILRQQQSAQASHVPSTKVPPGKGKARVAAKSVGKKKGPRTVEYICALCSEAYNSTCDCNPWWALTHHECPKCRKAQVPRVDITAPANAIEYHPALLAHAEEGANGGGSSANGPGVMHINPSHIPSSATFPLSRRYPVVPSDSDSGSDLSDISDGDLSDDSLDSDFDEFENMGALSPAEQAENELFGAEYNGPKLTDDETSRLLVLMSHASTCPGRHKHAKHRDVCSSVKYIMLHVRDCPGTTATYDICPFPWCRKVKHALYHLVSCARPQDCAICSPQNLSPNLTALVGLNEHRRKKQQERRAAAMAAAAAAAKAKPPPRAAPKSAKPAPVPKIAYKSSAVNPRVVKPGSTSAAKKGAIPVSSRPAPTKAHAKSTPLPGATTTLPAAAAKPAPTPNLARTKVPVASASKVVPVAQGSILTAPQKLSPAASLAASQPKPAVATTQTVIAPQKSALAIAAEAAKLQAGNFDTHLSPATASAGSAVAQSTVTNPAQPTIAILPTVTQPTVAVKSEVEAAVQATMKPSSGVQPRIATEESAVKETPAATFPTLPAAVEPYTAGETKVKVEGMPPEQSINVEHEPLAANALAAVPDSALTSSPPSIVAMPATTVPSAVAPAVSHEVQPAAMLAEATGTAVKPEHGADGVHDEATCPDECCAESRATAVGDAVDVACDAVTGTDPAEHSIQEEKFQTPSQSPESAEDLSRSSSCSDEVTKNEGVVRIGSC